VAWKRISRRLEEGISQDQSGIEARVRVQGFPLRRQRYALDVWYLPDGRANLPGRERVRAWVAAQRTALQEERRAFGIPTQTTRGTLETAVTEWQSRLNVRPGANADVSHMRAWLAATPPGATVPLAQWQLADITTKVIDQVIQSWQTAPSPTAIRKVRVRGFARSRNGGQAREVRDYVRAAPVTSGTVAAPLTIRHRCRAFTDLWRTTHGTKTTPMDDAKVPKRPIATLQPIPEDVLRTVLVNLRQLDEVTYAQFAIVCTCWCRPVAISRARPEDLHLEGAKPYWTLRSQKGAQSRAIELGPAAVAAWRFFIALNAWGEVQTTRYGNLIHKAGLPPTFQPYKARHSGAINALLEGVSMEKVSFQMGHASSDTTKRNYTGHVPDPSREIAAKTGARFLELFQPRLVPKREQS
jgi:integrase